MAASIRVEFLCDDAEGKMLNSFIDGLKNEDAEIRLKSINELPKIGSAFGAKGCREHLLPFLKDNLTCDEDKILLALAEQLQNFTPYVGGPEFTHYLLQPLELLLINEDNVIRNKAVHALQKIAEKHSAAQFEEYFIPMVLRLAKDPLSNLRIASSGLFCCCYLPSSNKQDLREAFFSLCRDDTPIVRRCAAYKLGKLASILEREFLLSDVLQIFGNLARDEQDSVRVLSMETGIEIIKLLHKEEPQLDILKRIVKELVQDKSYRVRPKIATKIVELQQAFGDKIPSEEIVGWYAGLLQDREGEVCLAAVEKLQAFCAALPQEGRERRIIDEILPFVNPLIDDPNQHIKIALSHVVMGLAPLIRSQGTVENLLPVFLTMLCDDTPEVRLNMISSLDKVINLISTAELEPYLMSAIYYLSKDMRWRNTRALIEYMPFLAEQLGQEFFEEKLLDQCLNWLTDHVYAIRKTTGNILKQLAVKFGADWAVKFVLPTLVELASDSNYLHRMTCLFCFNTLAEAVGKENVLNEMLPTIKLLSYDTTANVRFNVAKTLKFIGKVLDAQTIITEIGPIILRLCDDKEDFDVRYFADEAKEALGLTS